MKFSGEYGPLLIAEIGGNHEGDFSYNPPQQNSPY